MQIKQYTLNDRGTWDEFVRSSKMPVFMFERGFMEYHSDRFLDNSLMFYDDSELVALLPLNKKGCDLFSHGGLTFGGFVTGKKMRQKKMNEYFEALLDYARKNCVEKIIYKNVPHIYHVDFAEDDLYSLFVNNSSIKKIEPATVLNLKINHKIPKGRKAQISRAKREGVIICESEKFCEFIDLENEVLEKYSGNILFVGVNYDTETKEHTCKIEKFVK